MFNAYNGTHTLHGSDGSAQGTYNVWTNVLTVFVPDAASSTGYVLRDAGLARDLAHAAEVLDTLARYVRS